MGFRINSVRDAAIDFEATLERAGAVVDALESKRRCIAKLRSLISDGATSVQEAYDIVNARLEADVARLRKEAIAKSEVDSSNGYSRDFFVFESGDENRRTMSQVLEEQDHARTLANYTAIRDAVASMDSGFSETSTGIAVTITDQSTGQTVSSIGAQRAAALHEDPAYAWPALDLTSDSQWADADALNAARGLPTSSFSGSTGGPATRANNGSAGDSVTSFSKSAIDRARRVSERRDRDR